MSADDKKIAEMFEKATAPTPTSELLKQLNNLVTPIAPLVDAIEKSPCPAQSAVMVIGFFADVIGARPERIQKAVQLVKAMGGASQ
jgi:hypothetical protein